MGDEGDSGCLWVRSIRAEPRRLSPSEATQNRGGPIFAASASQALMTFSIRAACGSAFSRLQVPEITKGREPYACRSPDKIPNEKTLA